MIRVPLYLGTTFHDVPVPRFGTKFPERGTCPYSRILAAKACVRTSLRFLLSLFLPWRKPDRLHLDRPVRRPATVRYTASSAPSERTVRAITRAPATELLLLLGGSSASRALAHVEPMRPCRPAAPHMYSTVRHPSAPVVPSPSLRRAWHRYVFTARSQALKSCVRAVHRSLQLEPTRQETPTP